LFEDHRLGWNAGTVHCRCIWQSFATVFVAKTTITKLQECSSMKAQKLGEMHLNESSETDSNAFKVCSEQNCYLELVAEGAFGLHELYPTKLIQSLE
jgi:hypothetical protein